MTHTHHCKFCKTPIELESDDECSEAWLNILLKFAVCNRCNDYQAKMGALSRSIRKVCQNYIQLHNSNELTDDHKDSTRRMLATLTKSVAETICRFYGVNVVWEPDFVQQLIDRPEKSDFIISTYARMIRQSKQGTA